MANIILRNTMSTEDKIILMSDDAKFDVAHDKDIEQSLSSDSILFRDIKSKKAPPKVPKIFLSNNCIFNCSYCGCRASHDKERYCNNPIDLAKIAVDEAKNNGHGIFITSAIHKNADYTEELIVDTLKIMRCELHYNGYIHAKIMPGTDPLLIEQAGLYANRLSVNIEVAKSDGYNKIAKQKTKANILTPMKQISDLIKAAKYDKSKKFAVSQTTQLMAGSTDEDDRTIMTLSKALYNKYDLKRVYYTAFQYKYPAKGYELPLVSTPLWRTRRLYQADRLIQLYGFSPDDVTPQTEPNLAYDIDPKAAWALRNLHLFPVEINLADYEMLIRIPGIGITYAQKIVRVRKYCTITHDILKRIGVSLKKSIYYITCNGKYMGGHTLDNYALLKELASDVHAVNSSYEQLSFDII